MGDRNPAFFCNYPLDGGGTCRSYRLRQGKYCFSHDPSTKERNLRLLREAGALGRRRSQAARKRRRKTFLSKFSPLDRSILKLVPELGTLQAYREYVAALLPLALDGSLGENRDKNFLKLLELIGKMYAVESSGFIPPPVLPDIDGYAGHERDGSSAGVDEMAGDHHGTPPTVELLSDLDLGDDDDEESHRPDDTFHVLASDDSELTPQPMTVETSGD